MKGSIYFSFIFCFLVFNACEFPSIIEKDLDKEHKTEKEQEGKELNDDKDEGGDKESCFDLVFPISVTMPDLSVITEDDEDSLWSSIKTWYELNPDVEEKFKFNYPITIFFPEDDKQVIITSAEKLEEIKKYCYEDKGDCFEYVYPLSYLLPDGSNMSVNSMEELKAWYEANPSIDKKLELIYPFEVTFIKEEITKVISTEEEYKQVFEYCK